MTEEDFNQASAQGNVQMVEPEAAPAAAAPASAGTDEFAQYIPLLTALRTVTRFLSAAPTFIPQTFQDQIQFVYDGTHYYLYLWINNTWQSQQLNVTGGGGLPASPQNGDIIFYFNGVWVRLPIGSTGQALVVASGVSVPQWTSVPINVKTGWNGRDLTAVSSVQTIAHGLGKTPTFVRINASIGWSQAVFGVSNGIFDGTYTNCTYSTIYAGSTSTSGGTSLYMIYFMIGSDGAYATITVDATNIYLSWTLIGGGIGTTAHFTWEAWG